MRFKKIATKILAMILPVIIIAMAVMTIISVGSSKNIINDQVTESMNAELRANHNEIEQYLQNINSIADALATTVGTTYQSLDMPTYERLLKEIVSADDFVLGSGIWFEPYVYDQTQQYVGPYVYKDGDEVKTTYDYSNAEYDYFNQEYYLNAKTSDAAMITDPYYDETSGLIMSTCSAPIIVNDTYIGCVTVDMELSSITALVDAIQVGENGTAALTTADGVYLAGVDEEKLKTVTYMTEDENASVAAAGKEVLENGDGTTTYQRGSELYHLYYNTIDGVNWRLMIRMPESELSAPATRLGNLLLAVCVIAIVVAIIFVMILAKNISNSLKRVRSFAGSLAAGDFTVEPLTVESQDELGNMGESLNEMYGSNKEVIQGISEHAVSIHDASQVLSHSAEVLATQFNEIQHFMNDVNEAMMTSSAATEEVNASTEEVLSNVNLLAEETENSMEMATEIGKRAQDIGQMSQESYRSATQLSAQFDTRLQVSIENAKVVENIGELAQVISQIADQINLLALNASIEAARAGEAGRGFSVVASEIGKLASDTAEAVSKIQETIAQVQGAFNELTEDASGMLTFVRDTVTPDYSKFVDVATQYGEDAVAIEDSSAKISEMSGNIKHIMSEVTEAIQNIAESAENTADISTNIVETIGNVADNVSEVSELSNSQKEIAEDLSNVVNNFKL